MSDAIHDPPSDEVQAGSRDALALAEARALEFARPLPWTLLLLAGPIVGSMVSRTAMQWIDFVMVSTLGTEAQAAIVPAGITLFVVIAFGMGVLGAVNTLVAQDFGRGRSVACTVVTWQGLWLSAGLGVVLLGCWPLVPALFEWVGHEPAVVALETRYVQIGLLGIGPAIASVGVANFFNGIHRPMIGLWATVIANGFNVLANYALIFGKWGFPELGMDGAAWATALASWVNVLVLLAWWCRPALRESFEVLRHWRFHGPTMKQVLRIGLPSGLHFSADITTFAVFTLWIIGRMGTVELAAHNVALKFLELAIIPCVGMATAVCSAVGRAIGQGRPDRARRFAHWGQGVCSVFLVGMAGLFVLGPTWLMPMLTSDAMVAERATQLLLILAVCQFFDCAQILYGSALRGAGDTAFPAVATAITAVGLMLGGGYVLNELWPAGGSRSGWYGLFAYVAVLAVILWWRFVRGGWERIDLSEVERGGGGKGSAVV